MKKERLTIDAITDNEQLSVHNLRKNEQMKTTDARRDRSSAVKELINKKCFSVRA